MVGYNKYPEERFLWHQSVSQTGSSLSSSLPCGWLEPDQAWRAPTQPDGER